MMNLRSSICSVVWLYLISAAQQQPCDAWVSFKALSSSSSLSSSSLLLKPLSSSSIGQKRKWMTTRTTSERVSSRVVLSLAGGEDPTDVAMKISNTYVLIGGVVGWLAIAGFAFTKLTAGDNRPQAEKEVDAYYQLQQARKVSQRGTDLPNKAVVVEEASSSSSETGTPNNVF
eukprot:CAMPEP_0170994780 /NCGR_PEP_ID=MMETSP0736-20130129/11163_1 /TAXON_ID=186038 /ORGANISM="Fragilariopsis kerguelensis, Strain L26-C5" /LENGTH=172 /DNA_ID=CAMNT_0011420735 /DNA_START=129 /DNA_END=647 /DNA_ORIENTATION=-